MRLFEMISPTINRPINSLDVRWISVAKSALLFGSTPFFLRISKKRKFSNLSLRTLIEKPIPVCLFFRISVFVHGKPNQNEVFCWKTNRICLPGETSLKLMQQPISWDWRSGKKKSTFKMQKRKSRPNKLIWIVINRRDQLVESVVLTQYIE